MSRVCVPRCVLRSCALGAAAAALSISSASAATVVLKVSDPAGDVASSALDLVGATVTQDTSTGAVTASVVTAGSPKSAGAILGVALGNTTGTTCNTGASDNDGLFQFLVTLTSPPFGAWLVKGDANGHPIAPSVTGTGIVVSSGPTAAGKKLTWNCVNVSLQEQSDGTTIGDGATAIGAKTVPGSGAYVTTDLPDGDEDGVPNVADACPTVAGPRADGCLTIPPKLAYRLGAKRVVVDAMVRRAGTTCPAAAKLTLKTGRTKLAKGNLTVGTHGAYCHLQGIIRTKRHAKKAKLKITGTGLKAVSVSLKAG